MRKVGLLIALVAVAATITITLCLLPNSTMAAEVGRKLDAIMAGIEVTNSASDLSSNPYDYVRHSPSFDAIVALGYDALPVLEQNLHDSGADGLREYIVCIAIERISGCDLKQFPDTGWDRAQAFSAKWDEYLKGMPQRVKQIVESGQSARDKAEQIERLGAPAIPYVVEYAVSLDTADGRTMAAALATTLAHSKGGTTVGQFAEKNKEAIKKLKAYVEDR